LNTTTSTLIKYCNASCDHMMTRRI